MTVFRAIALCLVVAIWGGFPGNAQPGCGDPAGICTQASESGFPLVRDGLPASIHVDANDWSGVLRAAADLRADLAVIGGKDGELVTWEKGSPASGMIVIVGTLGQSDLIDTLVEDGRLDVADIQGRWEAYTQTIIQEPFPGVESALIVAGSDKRGTIYGIYDLSERAGVSPWHWWADVPPDRQANLTVLPGVNTDMPEVKYRGIFLNDENPALYGWANETFGGFNKDFYEKVFELILRQRGNYLWPAMWGKAFWDDDPENGATADLYGVVIGTSHHEPLMRAHVEWERYGEGAWDYTSNAASLQAFWRGGMERIDDKEAIVTVGMRGDGDEAMTGGTAIALLERIVSDQRQIIEDVTGRPAQAQPQLWALYKEVQDYYDQGMQVPDDITLLFADDNWGNIRRLPSPGDKRPGGYGVYYHFDYVGGPRNYKWLNTTQIERVWEQMLLAWEYDATEIWIVNVGDLKPMELPISFFLDFAWDPEDWPLERLPDYTQEWAGQQFGLKYAEEASELLNLYTKYNARRKPELLDAETYSVENYREFERVVADYNALAARADTLLQKMPLERRDAFLQLVWFPVHASANLNELYFATALNHLYAEQGRSDTNAMADRVAELFARDAELTRIYHEEIAGGKWNHMMSQTHIGYTSWQQPDEQTVPETLRRKAGGRPKLGVAIEGNRNVWPKTGGAAILPQSDSINRQARHFEVFNRGGGAAPFTVSTDRNWLNVSETEGRAEKTRRIDIDINWKIVPEGHSVGIIKVRSGWWNVTTIRVPVYKPQSGDVAGEYFSGKGVLSIPAAIPTRRVEGDGVAWRVIPNLGHEGDSIAAFPRTHKSFAPDGKAPRIEYDVHLPGDGKFEIVVDLAPTLDFQGKGGSQFAVSLDDQPVQIINANGDLEPSEGIWNSVVANNRISKTIHVSAETSGSHTVKLWLMDPGLAFQSVRIGRKGMPDSYLAPPYSARVPQ